MLTSGPQRVDGSDMSESGTAGRRVGVHGHRHSDRKGDGDGPALPPKHLSGLSGARCVAVAPKHTYRSEMRRRPAV